MGKSCPKGFLPVYSAETEKTANLLVTMACKLDFDLDYYAPELYDDQGEPHTGALREHHFVEFGLRLRDLHRDRLGSRP